MSSATAPPPTVSPAATPEPPESTTPKIRHLRVEGFRGFKQFEMSNLGRVNLLVGPNNGGKTSLLEAVHSLVSLNQNMMLSGIRRRGGRLQGKRSNSNKGRNYAFVTNLFNGYASVYGQGFTIESSDYAALRAGWIRPTGRSTRLRSEDEVTENAEFGTMWTINGRREMSVQTTVEMLDGELAVPIIDDYFTVRRNERPRPVFVTARSLAPRDTEALLNHSILTPDEDRLLTALRIVDSRIERIALLGGSRFSSDEIARNIMIRLAGRTDRVPIGYLGEGVWQMLGIALALVFAKGSCLLVDDIDTGLHYTVLEQMWKLIFETAKALDVQVFATTHSRDCVTSLASICRDGVDEGSEVTVQRIQPDRDHSIAYSEQDILALAEFGGEVR